jgi:hypothetical protein
VGTFAFGTCLGTGGGRPVNGPPTASGCARRNLQSPKGGQLSSKLGRRTRVVERLANYP